MYRIIILCAFALGYITTPALACDEVWVLTGDYTTDSTDAALRFLDAVFVGRVVRVEEVYPPGDTADRFSVPIGGYRTRATFAVGHAWIGPKDSVSVEWESNCEYSFEIGQVYLVEAVRRTGVGSGEVYEAPTEWTSLPLGEAGELARRLDAAAIRLRQEGLDTQPWH